MLRAPARDDDGVRHEIAAPRNQVAPNRRDVLQGSLRRRSIHPPGPTGAELFHEPRERLLSRAEKDRVGVRPGLVGKRRHVEPAERHETALRPIVVRDAIGTVRVGDVGLDDDEVGPVARVERLDVFVDDHGFIVWSQIGGERRKAERREQGVLDRAPIGAGRFRERRENELHAEPPGGARHALTLQ